MFSWRAGFSERELPPGVVTPPRDDLATRPRLVRTPRDSQFRNPGVMEHPALAVTRQACSILMLVGCIFGVAMAVIAGLYSAVSTIVVNETNVGHCPEQPITNGFLKAGFENGTAKVQCDPGYVVGEIPDAARQLRCSLVAKRCVVVKIATDLDGPIHRCVRTYVFTLEQQQGGLDVPASRPEQQEEAAAEAKIVADSATEGACVPDLSRQEPSRLYGEQKPVRVAPELPARAPRPRWTSMASSFAMSALMLTSLVVVVGAGVGRARMGAGLATEPDSAILLGSDPSRPGPDTIEDDSDADQRDELPL